MTRTHDTQISVEVRSDGEWDRSVVSGGIHDSRNTYYADYSVDSTGEVRRWDSVGGIWTRCYSAPQDLVDAIARAAREGRAVVRLSEVRS